MNQNQQHWSISVFCAEAELLSGLGFTGPSATRRGYQDSAVVAGLVTGYYSLPTDIDITKIW